MANETAENLTVQDISMIEKFKAKANEFMQALNKLNSIDDIPPNLQAEYSDLQGTAQYIQSTIGWITSTVDSITGFFSDFFQFDGISATRDYINGNNTNNLGLLPILPIAAITASLGVMSKFIADVYLFERKVTEQKRLEATGMQPEEAAQVVDKITGTGLVQNLAGIAKPVGFVLGTFFLLKIAKSYLK